MADGVGLLNADRKPEFPTGMSKPVNKLLWEKKATSSTNSNSLMSSWQTLLVCFLAGKVKQLSMTANV